MAHEEHYGRRVEALQAAVTVGTVNATGDRIFVDGQWHPYTMRNGVEVNILTSRLNSANEQIANLTGWLRAREATIAELQLKLAEVLHGHRTVGIRTSRTVGGMSAFAAGEVINHALAARNRIGLPLP